MAVVLPLEHKLWPSRGYSLLLLFLVHFLPNTATVIEGYSNVHFVSEPEDVYTTTSLNLAVLHCKAMGNNTVSGKEELLDVRFLRDDQLLSSKFFPADRHQYIIEGENDFVVGILINPIELSDNEREYKCQVRIDGTAVDVFSQTARILVGDGLPPAIPLTLSSVSLYQITVSWSSPMVPTDGPIEQYRGMIYTTSSPDVPIYTVNISDGDALQYTFTDLAPATSYRMSMVGFNMYGEGLTVDDLLEATTQSPVVTGQPPSLTFTTSAGVGNIIVSVEAPVVNSMTMTPVTEYQLIYFPSDDFSKSLSISMPASNPNFFLYNLQVGTTYTFQASAINSAGSSDALVEEFTVVSYNGTETVAPPTVTSTSTTTFTQAQPSTTTSTKIKTSAVVRTGSQTTVVHTTSSPNAPLSQSTTVTTSTTVTSSTAATTSSAEGSTTADQQRHTPAQSSPFTSSTSSSPSSRILQADVSTTTTSPVIATTAKTEDPLPINLVVLAIGCIALVILIAIIIVAVLLVFFCIRSRKDNENFTDFEQPKTSWPHKVNGSLKKTWGDSKESSIKGSPISGSISEDLELPIEARYLQVPSESPPSIRGDSKEDGRCAQELVRETEIKVEVTNGGTPV